jgi:hypothetical protein
MIRLGRAAFFFSTLSVLFARLVLPAYPDAVEVAIDPGANVFGVLSKALNSKTSAPGDTFQLSMTAPYPGGNDALANAIIEGHIATVTSGGQGRNASLDLVFDRIVLENGTASPFCGHVLRIDEHKASTAGQTTQGAMAGALAGAIAGRVLGAKALLPSLLVGAAGGAIYASNGRPNIDVPQGSTLVVQSEKCQIGPRRQADSLPTSEPTVEPTGDPSPPS